MGPDSQGRHLPRKLFLITPFLIVCLLLLIIFPWGISSHKNPSNDSLIVEQPEGREVQRNIKAENSGYNKIRTLNDNGSTTSGDGDGGDYVTGEFLRKALINHTLANGGEQDLDQLIFSALPEGSKLVLQSVKVVETDEHGNPLATKHNKGQKAPVHWDVKVTNATNEPDPDSETEEDESEEDEEDEPINGQAIATGGVVAGESVAVPVVKSAQGDLASSGSHSQANYKTYGATERDKEKIQKHHHGNDQGKTKKITHTDTDGKTVTNYNGKEDGVKDYKNNNGKSESNEHERYRDTKKKNKGRRVSGFKRVYHKEEFQRTEHFYDDEDAKRIAESYGMKDKKEDAKHGLKDDDRKYHGKKIEYTDGKEIKDEKGTSHGYNKGVHTAYKDSEKHHLNTKYAKTNSQSHGSPPSYNNQKENNYNEHEEQSPPSDEQYHHPSHNYHGSFSQPSKTTLRQPPATPNNYNSYYMNFKPGYLQNNFSPSTNPLDNADTIAIMSKVPLAASFIVTEQRRQSQIHRDDSYPASSTDEPTFYELGEMKVKSKSWKDKRKDKKQPDEIKMYFSPRHRHVKEMPDPDPQPQPGPPYKQQQPFTPSQQQRNQVYHPTSSASSIWDNFPKTTFTSKIGNEGKADGGGKVRNDTSDRDGRAQFVKANPLFDPNYGGYSTLVKYNPTLNKYINLGEEEGQGQGQGGSSNRNQSTSETQQEQDGSNEENGAVSDSQADSEQSQEPERSISQPEEGSDPHPQPQGGYGYRDPAAPQRRRPPGRSRWISLSLGDPELVKEIQANPFNRHQSHERDLPPIKMRRPPPPPIHKIIRPSNPVSGGGGGYPPPRFSPPQRPRPRPPGGNVPYPLRSQIENQSQYDDSKYPPNVVVTGKRSKDGGGHGGGGINRVKNSGGDRDPNNRDVIEEGQDHGTNQIPENDQLHKNVRIVPYSKPSQSLQGFHPVNNRNPKNSPRPHRIPHAIPPFMNTLMDSVANFFGSVG